MTARALLLILVAAVAAVGVTTLVANGGDDEPAAEPTIATESTTGAVPTTTSIPPMLGNALSLTDLDGWLQADFAGLDDLRGQVVIVQFWTFGCYNCKNTIPYLRDIYAEYHDSGLEIVGVHAPEFDYERDPDSILAAAQDLGVTWPIALDTDRRNFRAWQGSPAYWPRTYVLDQDGLIRFDHVGEGAYDELEQTVAALLSD
jgi:thiol-disulfide isomerase/thioredoxin